jgi:hypothetical protein
MTSVRQPIVAGKFYPADPRRLAALLDELFAERPETVDALAVMVPHAGYVYSGGCAAQTFARVQPAERVLLLGPNHTGRGVAVAAAEEDVWHTPLGNVPVDRELVDALVAGGVGVERDSRAHRGEHSLEVQLPFLQRLAPDVRVAPIAVGETRLDELLRLGRAMAAAIEASQPRPLIVVSSDMTHYESATSAREKDELALARLEALDPSGLHEVVLSHGITMCGFAPATAAAEALRLLGARRVERVCYTHSGLVTGDEREVVAYAGLLFR